MFLTFMIYKKTKDTDVYYLNIGDEYIENDGIGYSSIIKDNIEKEYELEKFIEFKYDDYRVTDLINTIRNNDYIYINNKKQTIQNALIKADITTLWIGLNDFKYGLLKENKEDTYNYMDTLYLDIETLLTEIKKYTKEQVFFIGYYTDINDKKIFAEYLNTKVEKLCNRYEIKFVRIKDNKNLYNIVSSDILDEFTFN